ncbi:hypothetical protein GCM10027589_50070 [Actinocorallia lasiicapitis]
MNPPLPKDGPEVEGRFSQSGWDPPGSATGLSCPLAGPAARGLNQSVLSAVGKSEEEPYPPSPGRSPGGRVMVLSGFLFGGRARAWGRQAVVGGTLAASLGCYKDVQTGDLPPEAALSVFICITCQ